MFYRTQKTSEFLNYDEEDPPQKLDLHCFSDASQQSFGACVYLKSKFNAGKVSAHLIASKSRLAPIKVATFPRLGLLGNLMLSRLINSVKNAGLDIRSHL